MIPTIEELKKAPREKHIPSYNYCGPKTQYDLRKSGKYEEMMKAAGKKLVGTKPYGKPKDSLDKSCMKHDEAYNDKNRTLESVRKADKELIEDANRIRKTTKNLKERLASFAVNKLMGAKVNLEDKGIMKKGSFADVPEAKKGGYIIRRNYSVY